LLSEKERILSEKNVAEKKVEEMRKKLELVEQERYQHQQDHQLQQQKQQTV